MDIEFEATYIDVDINVMRKKLKKLKAVLKKPETLMRRVVFHPPKHIKGGWMRVRDEGNKITMSLKQVTGAKIEEQKEVELIINDFEEGIKFLEGISAKRKSYQETKRESWEYMGVKVEIDTWPGLESFVEIEGSSERAVKQVTEKLGLDFSKAIFGAVDVVYMKKLGIPFSVINNQTPEITFKNPPKKYKPMMRKELKSRKR